MFLKTFNINVNKIVGNNNNSKVVKKVKNLCKFKKLNNIIFKNLTLIKAEKKLIFLIFDTKKIFNYL